LDDTELTSIDIPNTTRRTKKRSNRLDGEKLTKRKKNQGPRNKKKVFQTLIFLNSESNGTSSAYNSQLKITRERWRLHRSKHRIFITKLRRIWLKR
jgi:hypothetical protein